MKWKYTAAQYIKKQKRVC